MKEYKQFICGLGIRDKEAINLVTGEGLSESIMECCREQSNHGADQIYLLDCSRDEKEHEKTIGMIKEIAREVDTPLIVGGRVSRLEDVKKYLYAGAAAVCLDVSCEEQVDLMKEVSSRFGSEAIYAWLPDGQYIKRAEEYLQLGASRILVKASPASGPTPEEIQKGFAFLADASWSGDLDENGRGVLIFLEAAGSIPAVPNQLDAAMVQYLQLPFVRGIVQIQPREKTSMEQKQELKAAGIQMDTFESSVPWDAFKPNSDGLIPVIVQDYKTSQVLMLAYMNEEAFQKTLETGTMTYYSRSRKQLWRKGETSGHFQYVKSLSLDCDNDTILAKVHQIGAACHTGSRSCFFQSLVSKAYRETNPLKVFEEEYAVIQDRKVNPKEGSYTNYLFDKGIDKILKKCGEEATEIIIAAKNPDPEEIKYEIADFLYHVMVLMVEKGITWEEITGEIANR